MPDVHDGHLTKRTAESPWMREPVGRNITPALRSFVRGYPYERRTILAFLRHASTILPSGSIVLDAGSGDAPYRELFSGHEYITTDFAATQHHDFTRSGLDAICDLAALPFRSRSADAVLCTQVLEHVPRPADVLHEFRRILRPSGHLFMTVPLVGEIHEPPYDFFRYTPYSLSGLLGHAGFSVIAIEPRGGAYWALADLLHRTDLWLPPAACLGARIRNALIAVALRRLVAPVVAAGERWGTNRFTLGYACHARVAE